jgi:hypothetical protein
LSPTPAPTPPSTGLRRRTLVGAAAWTAPAIVLASAAPAYATSTELGIITFVDPEDIIGAGYTANLTVQLTVPSGGAVPANVSVGYSPAGIVSGPTLVPTGGKTTFTVPVKGLDVNGSTAITVSAPGYLPATTTVAVTFDNTGIVMLSAFTFGINVAANSLSPGSAGTRSTNAAGFLIDKWTGTWTYASTAATNTLRPGGQLFRGTPSNFRAMNGKLEWRMDVATTGSPHLIWQKNVSGFAFSGMPIGGTYQTGTAQSNGTLAGTVPAVRGSLTNTKNPGGYAIFYFTFPRFPNYAPMWTFTY